MLMTKSDLEHIYGFADVWDDRTGEWKIGHRTFFRHLIGEVEARELRPEDRLPRAYRVRVPDSVAASVATRARPPPHNTGLPNADAAPAGAAPSLARTLPSAVSGPVVDPSPRGGPVTRGRGTRSGAHASTLDVATSVADAHVPSAPVGPITRGRAARSARSHVDP